MRKKTQKSAVTLDIANLPEPPNVVDQERALLGAVLVSGNLIGTVSDALETGDFFDHANQQIFETMQMMAQRAELIDPMTITAVLKARGILDAVGNPSYLARLVSEACCSVSAPFYCDNIADRARTRQYADTAIRMMASAHASSDSGITSDDIAQEFATLIEHQKRRKTPETVSMGAALSEAATRLRERKERGQDTTGLSTGYAPLDRKVGGLRPGELTLIASRPGMGKTTFVMNIVLKHPDTGILWVSPEVGRENLADKIIAHDGRVNSLRFRSGLPSEELIGTAQLVATDLSERHVHIYDDAAPTVAQIESVLKNLKRAEKIELVIIDHLLRLTATLDDESSERRIADMVRCIGNLAKRNNVHVILLTQLNRMCEGRPNKRPMLSDLQGSGSTEQDADNVWSCYRDEYYLREKCPADQRGLMELTVLKARYGETGTVKMVADMATGRIEAQEIWRP